MRTPLAAALALSLALCAARPASSAEGAYGALVGMAAAPEDERLAEARLPTQALAAADAERARGEAVVKAPPARRSAWTRLFALLLPPSSSVPELKALPRGRRMRPEPPLSPPREADEGVRRGMAELMSALSAGVEAAAPARR